MTDNRTTLLPCPWCGGEASVKVMEYGDDYKVWGVFCESDLESEYGHGHFLDNFATEAEAIAAWNARATHGTLTAEQVRELIAPHLHARPTFDFGRHGAVWEADFQAIADELNAELGSGTCEIKQHRCTSCDHEINDDAYYVRVNLGNGAWTAESRHANFCPACGAKIRK